jgi:uncharacterized cupredoxin-like copper-binding protein
MKKLVVLLALFALVPFAFAACGGDDDNDVPVPQEPDVEAPEPDADAPLPNGAETVEVSADPDGALAFEQASLEVSAGEVTFEFDNPASIPHDFVIEDADGNDVAQTDVITNDSDSVTVDLEPGEYTFYCSVPGHREGGMEGPLTVD